MYIKNKCDVVFCFHTTYTNLWNVPNKKIITSRIDSWCQSYDRELNATNSLSRFENKNIFFYFEKRSSLLQRCKCSN
jgi:hypothetical protein